MIIFEMIGNLTMWIFSSIGKFLSNMKPNKPISEYLEYFSTKLKKSIECAGKANKEIINQIMKEEKQRPGYKWHNYKVASGIEGSFEEAYINSETDFIKLGDMAKPAPKKKTAQGPQTLESMMKRLAEGAATKTDFHYLVQANKISQEEVEYILRGR